MTESSHVEYVDFRPEAREAWRVARRFESEFSERINLIVSRQDKISDCLCDALSTENISKLLNYYETTDEVMSKLEESLIKEERMAAQEDDPKDAVVYAFPSHATNERVNLFNTDTPTASRLSLVKRLKSPRQ